MLYDVVPRKPTAKPVSYRLTEEARTLLAEIAERQGISLTAALEVLIRQQAASMGIKREESGHEKALP